MRIRKITAGIMAAALMVIPAMSVYASDGEEYITITVQASDDNEGITYALDNDDPGSFGPSNMFTIPAGTSHTIYVRDAAGNITSQVYEPPESEEPGTEAAVTGNYDVHEGRVSEESESSDDTYSGSYSDDTSGEYDGQTIDIDLELKKSESDNEKPYEIKKDTPAEQGEGTVYSKTFLDGTDSSEQVFYSMTTAEGDVFYLLLDQGQESNNVYLLNQVNNQDLAALAADGGNVTQTTKDSGDDSLLKALSSSSGNEGNITDNSQTAAKKGINKNTIILLLIMAAGGGFYYYQKVYKAKKEQEMDAMEAPDMDQFSAEESENEEEEFDFEYGDADKEQYLRDLIKEDEEAYAAAAESEAADAGWDHDDEHEDFGAETTEPEEDIFGEEPGDADDIFSDPDPDGEYDPELDGEEEVE